MLTLNALAAAHAVLAPLQCEFFAMEGLSQLLRTIEEVREGANPELRIHGIVLTMYDARNNLANQVVADVRGHLGRSRLRDDDSAQREIVRSAVLRQAGAAVRHQVRGASQAYLRLVNEVMDREERMGVA